MSLSRRSEGLGQPSAGAPDPDDVEAAEASARRMVAAAERSRFELLRRLERKGFSRATATAALDRLEARGWVDDARVAEVLGRRALDRHYGQRRLTAELATRGIDATVISRVSEALASQQAEGAQLAADRLRRRYPEVLGEQDLHRIAAALRRRGFGSDDIRAALRRLDMESREPPSEPPSFAPIIPLRGA